MFEIDEGESPARMRLDPYEISLVRPIVDLEAGVERILNRMKNQHDEPRIGGSYLKGLGLATQRS